MDDKYQQQYINLQLAMVKRYHKECESDRSFAETLDDYVIMHADRFEYEWREWLDGPNQFIKFFYDTYLKK